MGDKTHFLPLCSGDQDSDQVYCQATWLGKNVTLAVLEGADRAWTVSISAGEVESLAQEHRLGHLSDWFAEAFTTGSEKNLFSITDGQFVWRRRESDRSKIVLLVGQFQVESAHRADLQGRFLSSSMKKMDALASELASLSERHDKLMGDLRSGRNRIRVLTEEKKGLETQLLGQFLALLNAKQDKIQELQNELAKSRHGTPKSDTPTGFDQDETAYDSATDDEEPRPGSSRRAQNDSQNFLMAP